MSKQDRQGVRTASDLEQKYQFGKQFAEIMGIALDTQKSVSEVESSLSQKMLEQETSITRDTEKILLTALEQYVETSDFEEFKKTLEAEFGVWSGGIFGRVSATEEAISGVDADLQEKFNTITKYFTFTVDGLTIGQVDNPNKVVIDNDDITILVGDKVVQTFKADGTGLIPILKVTQMANIMGLQITQDTTHINWDYTGEVT